MKKLLTLSKDQRIKVSSKIESYLFPKFIYLNVEENTKFMIQKRNIKKGEKIFCQDHKTILSPVSGTIEGIIEKEGKYYLKIENDFKEDDSYNGVKEYTTKALKLNFSTILEETGMDTTRFKNKQRMILNGIEDEPYLVTKTTLHKSYAKEILSTLDLLASAFSMKTIQICLKENDRESIEAFSSEIGTYPNITLEILGDMYPIGEDNILKNYLKLKEETYIISTEEVLNIYEEGLKKRSKDIVFVTFTGDAIKNPMVVKVKIGTPLKDIIKDLLEMKKCSYDILLNGLMRGTKIQEEAIIDEKTRAIYFMKTKERKESFCISCGKCIEVCPFHCNPYRAFLKNEPVIDPKCVSCGLCTFICPSNIKLEHYIKGEEK